MRPWMNAALMLVVLCAGAVSERNASAADPQEFLEGRLVEAERKFRFHEWAGHVKIPGKQVTILDFAPRDFEGFADVAFLRRLPQEAALHVSPADVRKGGRITVTIALNDSVLDAQRRILRGFAMMTSPSETWKDTRAEKGTAYDVGDVCFPSPLPIDIRFTRNNAFVRVRGSEKSDPADVLHLAKQIDAKLVSSLVDIGAELPPGKIEESTKPAPPGLPRELVAAIEQDDLDRLLSFVRRPERELRRAAIDALAKTPEGRAVLARDVLSKEVSLDEHFRTLGSAIGEESKGPLITGVKAKDMMVSFMPGLKVVSARVYWKN